jgi:WD40 repeat protein
MRLVRTKLLGRILAAIISLPASSAVAQDTPDIVWQSNGHAGSVLSVAFSGDGRLLASGSEDGTSKLWTVPKGDLVRTVFTHAWVTSVALYPPADLLLTAGDDGAARPWSIGTGALIAGGSSNGEIIWSANFSPDGTLIAFGWTRSSIPLGNSTGPGGLLLQGHASEVYSVVFSPDGSKLASGSADGTAKIWRVSDGTMLQSLAGHSVLFTNEDDVVINPVWDVDFSPDGALLVTVGADNTARLWQVPDGTHVRVINCPGCGSVNFSADGKILFTVSGGAIQVWRVSGGQLLYNYTNADAGPLAVASDGKYFAYGRADGAVVLARVPVVVDEVREGDQTILRWTGGSGLYRIQRRNDPTRGVWHNFGPPTTATSFTNEITREPVFYHVISLPNP